MGATAPVSVACGFRGDDRECPEDRTGTALAKQKGRNDVPALREDPSQGDNPNIALTRPQIISPLTLVG